MLYIIPQISALQMSFEPSLNLGYFGSLNFRPTADRSTPVFLGRILSRALQFQEW